MAEVFTFLDREFQAQLHKARVSKGYWTLTEGELKVDGGERTKAARPNRPIVLLLISAEEGGEEDEGEKFESKWWYGAITSLAQSGEVAVKVAVVPNGDFDYGVVIKSFKRDVALLLIDADYNSALSRFVRLGGVDQMTICDADSPARPTTAPVIEQVLADQKNCYFRKLVQRLGFVLPSSGEEAFATEGGGAPDDLSVYDIVISPDAGVCSDANICREQDSMNGMTKLSALIQPFSSHLILPPSTYLDLPTARFAASQLLSLTVGRPLRRASISFNFASTKLGGDDNAFALLPPFSTLSPLPGRGVGGDWTLTLFLNLHFFRPPDDGFYCVEYSGEGGENLKCVGDLNQGTANPEDANHMWTPVHIDVSEVWGREDVVDSDGNPRVQQLQFKLTLRGGSLESPGVFFTGQTASIKFITTREEIRS